jgi:REP element-mobilizing transposase RayT
MSRRARRDYETSFFHVIVQGYDKEYIFNIDKLIEKYRKLLIFHAEKYKIKLLAYCIMNNHAHIVMHVENIKEMSKFMKKVNETYANYYNKFINRVGYVFRDRYLSEPIYNEKYLYNCIAYIHMNPVKASIVATPSEYQYSSYNDFLNNTGVADKECIKLIFGSQKDYIEQFKFIHYEAQPCMDYKEDLRTLDENDVRQKIKKILEAYYIIEEELKDVNILKYFIKIFNREKISDRKIERILHIDHRKIKKIMQK